MVNSPQQLGKLNLSTPLFSHACHAGLEVQYVGSRNTLQSAPYGRVSAYWLTNATLYSTRLADGMEASISVYNVFDHRYADPAAEEHVMDAIVQDGRNFRLKLTYNF